MNHPTTIDEPIDLDRLDEDDRALRGAYGLTCMVCGYPSDPLPHGVCPDCLLDGAA